MGFLLAIPGPALAGFDEGMAAAKGGNYRAAYEIWRPLATASDIRAQYNLAVLYDRGFGVPQDYAEAAKWYRAAAERGDIAAQANLGTLYANGWGVARDNVLTRRRDDVAQRLTPEQILEAQRLAREWRPKAS